MKAAPPIISLKVIDNFKLKIEFEDMLPRIVDLKKFPLLGQAKKLIIDEKFLKSFKLIDGIPEWNGQCLLGPEDLLKRSTRERNNPPRDGCGGYKDPHTGEFDCEYEPPFPCEECMYCKWNRVGGFRGKNPQAEKWRKDEP